MVWSVRQARDAAGAPRPLSSSPGASKGAPGAAAELDWEAAGAALLLPLRLAGGVAVALGDAGGCGEPVDAALTDAAGVSDDGVAALGDGVGAAALNDSDGAAAANECAIK